MSVIETFYLLFKSDTTDLKKGTDEAKKSADKLNESLLRTETASDKIGQSFLGISRSFAGMIAAAFSVGAVIEGVKKAADYTLQLDRASQALQVNAQLLDAWGGALQQTGGSTESFERVLSSLASHFGTTASNAVKLLPQLADSFHRMSQFRAMNYGKMLGLDEPTILLLMKGRREVDALIARQKELGTVQKQDLENTRKFNYELQDFSRAIRGVFIELASTVLPVLTKILDFLTPIAVYFQRHKDVIVGALLGIAIAAAAFAIPFVIANAAVIGTTLAVAALIAAFGLLYEDIKYFIEGQDSLIGRMLQRWPIIGEVVKNIIAGWKAGFQEILKIIDVVSSAFEKVASFFSGGDKKFSASVSAGQQNLALASSSLIGAQTSNSILNSRAYNRSNVLQTGDITINTQATDADGISTALNKSLSEHLWQANSNFDDGVVA